ncbi:MAG: TonB-dependent receptor [Candidatus Sphingomonas colombiensis]|nr:TonB-dependent receptor [Sphingomonas sp.]WEK42912.1 MAG: TonB-dependent receptor [Sphingomonas sp.]
MSKSGWETRIFRRFRSDLCATSAHVRSGQTAVAIAFATLIGATPLHAQQVAAPVAEAKTNESAEVVVTGSQVARSGFVSATPLTAVNSDDILRVGAVNVADALNQLPAMKPSVTPSSVSNLSKLAGGNYMDLRGLGYLRTLTVIDGKRYVPTTPEGVINTNLIPQALIGGVDVVTGGASAAYGSDAVAGVVNFKIDNKFNGVRGSVQGGITDHDDNRNYMVSLAFGTKFAGDRGHLLIGLEAAENGGIKDANQRKWAGNRGIIVNPANATDPSQPFYIHVNDARASYAAPGGVINSGVLSGIQFGPNGTTLPFRYGNYLTADNTMDGGDGDALASPYVLVAPTKRQSAYAGLTYEVAPSLTAYASFTYARSRLNERSIPSDDVFTIKADNAFLPQSLRTALATAGETSFSFGRSLEDYGVGAIKQKATTWQGVAGLRGGLGGSWSFDASFSFGKTDTVTLFTGDVIKAKRLLALDAVVNPVTGGTVCRSTLTDPTNGCVPLNLFGVGTASQQAIDYITGTSVRGWRQSQQVADIVVRGEPFSTWAGPVSVAFGGEYRNLNVDVTSDPISATPNVSLFRVGNVKPYSAREAVKEAFVEAVVPLATDAAWAKNLELDLGGRITDYRTSGTVETWKIGVNYAVNDSIRFRATRSRDIRAPNINELFAAGQTLLGGITDTKTSSIYTVSQTTGGNPFLKPERANTLTAGGGADARVRAAPKPLGRLL